MSTNRDDWEVMSCEWVGADCNYKVVVAKGTDSDRFEYGPSRARTMKLEINRGRA